MRSILDPAFRYVPSFATSVAATWRRFGWRPTTDEDRNTRRRPAMELVVDWVEAANVLSPSAFGSKLSSLLIFGAKGFVNGVELCPRS